MITKPNGYDEAEAMTGDFTMLPLDGYVCIIKGAQQTTSKSGNDMLVLALDIAEGDHKGFYNSKFKADTRADKKWPCVYRQLLIESSAQYLKGLMTCIERSNSGFKWDWDEKKLVGKLVGMIFRKEEYAKSTGGTGWSVKPFRPRSAQKIREGDFEIPEDKRLENQGAYGGGFEPYPDYEPPLDDEQMPF